MNKPMNKPSGPDPAVEQAVRRLSATQLSPLEETIFQSWATANQIDDPDGPDSTFDFRDIYKKSGGKVMPPGQLKRESERAMDIKTLMEAQKAHDDMAAEHAKSSPISALMAKHSSGGGSSMDSGGGGGVSTGGGSFTPSFSGGGDIGGGGGV